MARTGEGSLSAPVRLAPFSWYVVWPSRSLTQADLLPVPELRRGRRRVGTGVTLPCFDCGAEMVHTRTHAHLRPEECSSRSSHEAREPVDASGSWREVRVHGRAGQA